MLDINIIRNNPEMVKENIKKKFQDQKLILVDEVVELDKKVRALKIEGDDLRAMRKTLSNHIISAISNHSRNKACSITH